MIHRVLHTAIALTICTVFTPAHAQTIIYVDDDASLGGDGTSWSTAYKYLQDALYEAETPPPPVTVRVAQGTYKPDHDEAGIVTPGDTGSRFELVNGLTLKGGFAGITEPDPNEQNPDLYETVLSGDLKGNDEPGFVNFKDNSGIFSTQFGSDIGVAIADCSIAGAAFGVLSDLGGAIDAPNRYDFRNCLIAHNRSGSNGVLSFRSWVNVSFTDCLFESNEAEGDYLGGGGAVHMCGGSAMFLRCTFRDNHSDLVGGAVAARRLPCDPVHIIMSDCLFEQNQSMFSGGAVFLDGFGADIDNCSFLQNESLNSWGGGLALIDSQARVTNCEFHENIADAGSGHGGGLLSYIGEECVIGGPFTRIANCTFVNNEGPEGNSIAVVYTTLYPHLCDQLQFSVASPGLLGDGTCLVRGADLTPLSIEPGGLVGTLESDLEIRLETHTPDPDFDTYPTYTVHTRIGIAGSPQSSDYDRIVCRQRLELDDTISVQLLDGFIPSFGDCFDLIAGVPIEGQFDVALLPDLPGDLYMTVQYGPCAGGPVRGSDTVSISVQSLDALVQFGSPTEPVDVSGVPTSIVTGDFDPQNNNGLDLALTVSGSPGHVLLLFNDGNGDFVSGPLYTVGDQPVSITTADFDGVNGLDLAVANFADDTYQILFNNGDGSFSVNGPVLVGSQPADIDTGLLNEDGHPDLVTSLFGNDDLAIMLNDGAGGFPMIDIVDVGDEPIDVDPIDIDDDKKGHVDLAVANRGASSSGGNSIIILHGDGTGKFNSDNSTRVSGLNDPTQIIADDLNGDGLREVAVTNNTNPGSVGIIVNQGAGTFSAPAAIPIGGFPRSITSLDLDLDGDLDIAIVADDPDTGDPVVRSIRNDTNQGQQLTLVVGENLAEGEGSALVIHGDVDADGDDDLVTVSSPTNERGKQSSVTVIPNLQVSSCVGDIAGPNGTPDQTVNDCDLLALVSAWGTDAAGADIAEPSQIVDVFDLLGLLATWGDCSR